MKRAALVLGGAAVGIVLIALIAIVVLQGIYLTPQRLEQTLSGALGREVEIEGPVDLSLWGEGRLTLSQLRVANPTGSAFKRLLTLDAISVGLRWWDLPALITSRQPHFLDIEARGGKVHVDARQDVVGDDGVWPSADDPFTGMLGWIDSLHAADLQLEVQAGSQRVRKMRIHDWKIVFGTGPAGAVIIDSKEFDLAIDEVPVKGALRLEAPLILPGTAPPAALTGNLEIDQVDLRSLFKPSPAGGSVPPSEDPSPVHTCLAWDVGLELALGAVQLGGASVTSVRFDVKSSGGDWKLRLLDAQFPAGEGEAEVSLRCGRLPVEFDLRSRVRSKGKSHFGQSGATVEVLGRMESILVLRSQGSTWREGVADLAGRFAVFLGPVQTGALADSFYARGLFHALTVSWRQSQKAVVDCAIIDMHIEKGVAQTHQVVIATPTLVIDGHGEVELAEDRVDIALIPRPKHPRLGTLHVPVRVSGSIEKPHVGLDWEDVLPRIGMETATAIVEPLFPFDGPSEEELAACRRSLEPLKMAPPESR